MFLICYLCCNQCDVDHPTGRGIASPKWLRLFLKKKKTFWHHYGFNFSYNCRNGEEPDGWGSNLDSAIVCKACAFGVSHDFVNVKSVKCLNKDTLPQVALC